MKNYISDADYWMVKMHPDDKVIVDALKVEWKCSSYRDVFVHAVKQANPDTSIRLRTVGDLDNHLPGLAVMIALLLKIKEESYERGFIEFMEELRREIDKQYDMLMRMDAE